MLDDMIVGNKDGVDKIVTDGAGECVRLTVWRMELLMDSMSVLHLTLV